MSSIKDRRKGRPKERCGIVKKEDANETGGAYASERDPRLKN